MLKSIQSNNSPGHSHNRLPSVVDLSVDSCPGIILKRNNKMKQIIIRKHGFDNLFKYVLSINFAENWEMCETTDIEINPLVIFKTKKWNKLENLIDVFLNKHKPNQYTEKTSKMDLICGSFQEIKYKIFSEKTYRS